MKMWKRLKEFLIVTSDNAKKEIYIAIINGIFSVLRACVIVAIPLILK